MSRRNDGSSVWKTLSVIFGILLFGLIVFGVFLGVSQRVSGLDPAETETTSEEEVEATGTAAVEQDFEGFTMTIGVAAVAGQTVNQGTSSTAAQTTAPVVDDPAPTSGNGTQTAVTTDSDYLCPESSTTYLTKSRVDELDAMYRGTMPDGKSVPQMIINEIYAKNGYRFKNQILQAYYDAKPWYNGYISDMQTVTNKLNSVEKANVDFLRKNYTG